MWQRSENDDALRDFPSVALHLNRALHVKLKSSTAPSLPVEVFESAKVRPTPYSVDVMLGNRHKFPEYKAEKRK